MRRRTTAFHHFYQLFSAVSPERFLGFLFSSAFSSHLLSSAKLTISVDSFTLTVLSQEIEIEIETDAEQIV